MNSIALNQIENLGSEEKTLKLSIIENLDEISWGIIIFDNSFTFKGKIFVLPAISKIINIINRRNNQIDNEVFKNIKEDSTKRNN